MKRLTASLIVVLTGCAAGPDYRAPAFGDDTEWRIAPSATADADIGWWRDGGDPTLARLIALALEENRELEGAIARVEAAVAGRRVAGSVALPSLIADARYTRFEQSVITPRVAEELIRQGIIPRDGEFYNAALEASWELDFAGRIRRGIERADAQALAAVAAADGVALQVVAETAIAYTDWQALGERLRVAERNIELQSRTRDIIDGKVRLGLARKLDAVRAGATLAELRANLPALQAARTAAAERLAVLVGRTSEALAPLLADADAFAASPAKPSNLRVGLKSELLRRRPDIRAAERTLAAAVAGQGVAAAQFFPSVVLSASAGFEAGDTGDLFSGDARSTGLVPFLRWPVFQGGRLRAEKAIADARQREALASYEQAVLQAFADSESAIAGYQGAWASLDAVAEAQALASEAETLAARLYREGLVDYLTLLDAQRQLAAIDDALAVSRGELRRAAVRLYKSLGGDWSAETAG